MRTIRDWAYIWDTRELYAGKYEQEWVFPTEEWIREQRKSIITSYQYDELKKIRIRTRLGNKDLYQTDYKKGDIAPPNAQFHEVELDKAKGAFVLLSDSGWIQKQERKTSKLAWTDSGCRGATITLPDHFEKNVDGTHKYRANFLYHENGDKEFYVTRRDGSLWLWGKQEPDRTIFKYKYGHKLASPEQIAHQCDREVHYAISDTSFPFTFWDENIAKKKNLFILQNAKSTTLRVFRNAQDRHKTYRSHTLQPGGYAEFQAKPGEKIAVLEYEDNDIRYVDRFDVCLGAERVAKDGGVANPYHKFGNWKPGGGGLTFEPLPETKKTDATEAKKACSEYVDGGFTSGEFAGRSRGRLAVVEFKNNGSIPLEIFRLAVRSEKVSPDGKGRTNPENFDLSARLKDLESGRLQYVDLYDQQYMGLKPIVTLPPWQTRELKTRVGYAFIAITRGTERHVREWRDKHGKVRSVLRASLLPEGGTGKVA